MFNEFDFAPLYDFFTKILIFLERPSFQIQLLAIFLIMLGAWLIAKVMAYLMQRIQKQELPNYLETYLKPCFIVINYLNFPLLSIILITITSQFLISRGWLIGLVSKVTNLFWAMLIYRFFLGVLYCFFSKSTVRPYHYRLFTPLFILFLLREILFHLANLELVSKIVLTSFLDTSITIGSLLRGVIGLYLWIGFLWLAQSILYELITQRSNAEADMVEGLLTSSRYILIILGIILLLSHLGFNTATLAAITGGLSLGIGFGLQEIMGNFISGILLFLEGALKPGDIVEVDGEMAVVKRLSIRATTVQTFNHVEKIVPNHNFLASSVTTYTGSDRLIRCLIPIGVSYKSRPELVTETLLKVAKEHPSVLKKPKPVVFLIGFGESSIDFELSVWINNPINQKVIISELNQGIWQSFEQHKIEIPFPQRDLHIHNISSGERLISLNGKSD